jgi:hypothetical protein
MRRYPLDIGVLARPNLKTTMLDFPVVSEIVVRGVVALGNEGFFWWGGEGVYDVDAQAGRFCECLLPSIL